MMIVAIIPAYNEEKSVGAVISETKKFVDEVIVIDDGSTDSTAKVAKSSGARVFSHPANKGLGYTMLEGYRIALARGADIILQTDADGQYLCSDIPKLLDPIKNGKADMVIGSRFSGSIEEMPFLKKRGNRFFSRLTSLMAGMRVTDAQTGFRAMTRDILIKIVPVAKYTYTQEMLIRSAREGFTILEVPIHFAKRKYGKSRLIGNIFDYGINASMILMRTIRDYKPIMFFGAPGVVLFLFGFGLGLKILKIFFTTGQIGTIFGIVTLSSFFMIDGMLFIFMGLFADMIQSKYIQIREHITRQ